MASAFGSCGDKFVTFDDTLFDSNGDRIVRFTSAEDPSVTVDLCLDPLKGASIDGVAVVVENGILQLPTDLFGSGEVSVDGETYTITFPGQAPQELCINPQKGTVDSDGVDLVNGEGVAELPPYVISVTGDTPDGVDNTDPQNPVIVSSYAEDNGDGTTTTYHPDGSEHTTCDEPVKSVSGDSVDNTDPQNPVISSSSTVPSADGVFHEITTADGVTTNVCLRPVKSFNGGLPDINGNIQFTDLFSNTVDNGDGTYTTTNTDATTVTWSGDTFATQMNNGNGTVTFTMADSSTVTLCLNPVKELRDNGDGSYTVVFADGTTGETIPAPWVPTSDDNTLVITPTTTGYDFSDPDDTYLAAAAGVDFHGVPYAIDDVIIFINGKEVCIPAKPEPTENPSISLVKAITSGAGPYFEGDTIDYSFTVTNTGDVDLTGVVVTDPLLTVSGGPIALVVGASDATTFTGSYVVTAADATAGMVDNTAATEGTSPQGVVVSDTDTASAATEEAATVNKVCGLLPMQTVRPSLLSGSNPQTNADGVTYNVDAVHEFRAPGGQLMATLTGTRTADNYDYLFPEDFRLDIDGVIDHLHPASWIDQTVFYIGTHAASGFTAPVDPFVEWDMAFELVAGDDLSINGCDPQTLHRIVANDVDNGSTIGNMSRPWDDESQEFQTPQGVYTDNGDGSFTFPFQSQYYLYWDSATLTDSLTYNYTQDDNDGLGMSAYIEYRAAVCVVLPEGMDPATATVADYISVDTIDGPLDPATWADIELV